uniref:Ribosomal protein L2 n=1 Tax=Parascaris univalens TaxID=6257 RepID=A0A915AG68_PARUN
MQLIDKAVDLRGSQVLNVKRSSVSSDTMAKTMHGFDDSSHNRVYFRVYRCVGHPRLGYNRFHKYGPRSGARSVGRLGRVAHQN